MRAFNKIKILSFLLLIAHSSYSQKKTIISLEKFTPKETSQEGPNCWAYASAYVAASTRLAYIKKDTANENDALSYGIVCSEMQLTNKNEVSTWSNTLFPDCKDTIGNLDFALYCLTNYGTILLKKFIAPIRYTRKKHINRILKNQPKIFKIKDIEEIISKCSFGDTLVSIQKIKNALLIGKPIVCAVKETLPLCSENFIVLNEKKIPSESNHIVTIVGYNEEKNQFLIKNNFSTTCTSWIDCEIFLSVTSWAYIFDVYEVKQ